MTEIKPRRVFEDSIESAIEAVELLELKEVELAVREIKGEYASHIANVDEVLYNVEHRPEGHIMLSLTEAWSDDSPEKLVDLDVERIPLYVLTVEDLDDTFGTGALGSIRTLKARRWAALFNSAQETE